MSEPLLRVDTASPVPPYEQIRVQLSGLITGRRLAAGERLPPVRQVAGDLGLAVGTVARAYRELEAAGLVHSRRGAGTRVAELPAGPVPGAALARLAAEYVEAARRLGADDAEACEAVLRATSGPQP